MRPCAPSFLAQILWLFFVIDILDYIPESIGTILLVVYIAAVLFTVGRILLDTQSSSKTLAYIMLVLIAPVVGMAIYFSFGVNYRHRRLDARRQLILEELGGNFSESIPYTSKNLLHKEQSSLDYFTELSNFIYNLGNEGLTRNFTKLLVNGEEKFPEVMAALEKAEQFIHIEYYTWENDKNGNALKDLLIKKAAEGVEVRVLYDDFGSRTIRKNVVRDMKANGIEVFPVIKVNLVLLANRLNHRDHRKIVIIDGHTGFVGGINYSDRYDNRVDTGLYWRDTHLKIVGRGVLFLQRHFVATWNDCQSNWLYVNSKYFPKHPHEADKTGSDLVQIVGGGPIYRFSTIMMTYMKIFNDVRGRLFITNPYFIPNESIHNILKQASLSGVDVRMILPGVSDSMLVDAASKFYFRGLLEAGVRIYQYNRGFVHAKTVVADGKVAVVGTANMDNRSFDLNYEIMAVTYGKSLAGKLEQQFYDDLNECTEITLQEWRNKPLASRLAYAVARLVSSLL